VALRVLQPVERRRRRRRGTRRFVLAAVLVVAGAAVAVWRLDVPFRQTDSARPAPAPPARPPSRKPGNRGPLPVQRPVRPLTLVTGRPALRGRRFSPALRARSAILVDAHTGRVLWALRPRRRRAIASTTKIMTALLALQRLPLHGFVTVDPEATRVPLVKEGLRPRERVRVWKLLYGLLLYSGNDDATALAIASGGSRRGFLALMNDEAHRLGLHDTHFNSPSGALDSRNFSTARDLAALTRYALRDARFRRIVRTRVKLVRWSAPTYAKEYLNKNLLLGRYRGANGVKTGWTKKAGHCLVASAKRGRVELIAVVLRSGDEYRDARRLLDLGFREVAAG
jgi:serine-type D-Ala-D-Ala carboxypeptidase (penicillin-binding protein 5/6)